jgi:hypothetical protein
LDQVHAQGREASVGASGTLADLFGGGLGVMVDL